MIRIVQIALLIAAVITLGMALKALHAGISDSGRDIWTGIVIGFLICYALWRWDDRIRQRDGKSGNGKRGA